MPTVSGVAESLSKISDSTVDFTKTMKGMPQQVRKEVEGLLEHVDASQPELRTTLGEAQKTVTLIKSASHDVKDVVTEVKRTVSGVVEASAALETAANAVTTTVKEIQKFMPASKKDFTRAKLRAAGPPDFATQRHGVVIAPRNGAPLVLDGLR